MSNPGFLGDVDEKGRNGGVGPARAQKSTVHDPQNPKPEEIKDSSTLFSEMQEGKADFSFLQDYTTGHYKKGAL